MRIPTTWLTLGFLIALAGGTGLPAQAAEPEQAVASRSVEDFKAGIALFRQAQAWSAVLDDSREMQRQHGSNDEAAAFAMGATCEALVRTARYAEAIATADEVSSRFGKSEILPIQEEVARSLVMKASALAGDVNSPQFEANFRQALSIADEVVVRYGKSEAPSLRWYAAAAMVFKAGVLMGIRQPDEAMAAFDAAVGYCGSDEEAVVVRATEGLALSEAGRGDTAIGVLDAAIARYAPRGTSVVSPVVVSLYVGKCGVLVNMGRKEEGVAVLDEAITRFAPRDAPLTQQFVGVLFLGKSVLLSELGRTDEAIGVLDDLEARCANSEVREIRELGIMAALIRSKLTAGEKGSKDEPRH